MIITWLIPSLFVDLMAVCDLIETIHPHILKDYLYYLDLYFTLHDDKELLCHTCTFL